MLFPYDVYRRRAIGSASEYCLIPSRDNIAELNFAASEEVVTIEKRFPRAWKYLCDHEAFLRKRENNRFRKGSAKGNVWYEAARPQNLDFYFKPKLLVQLLSRRNSFCGDMKGRFLFQGGGKGGGAYGVAPKDNCHLLPLVGYLNSAVIDYLVKETTSVYGARFYSYSDQFLRDLPIPKSFLVPSEAAERVSAIAENISELCDSVANLRQQIERLPDSFSHQIKKFELTEIRSLLESQPKANHINLDPVSVKVEKLLYTYAVDLGVGSGTLEFREREHCELVARILRILSRDHIESDELVRWRVPATVTGCKVLLGLIDRSEAELARARTKAAGLEKGLDDIVYSAFGLARGDRRVIDEFLGRYTSIADGVVEEEAMFVGEA